MVSFVGVSEVAASDGDSGKRSNLRLAPEFEDWDEEVEAMILADLPLVGEGSK